MTKVLFVRHGEADYSGVGALGYSGFGRDLAPLSALGVSQAEVAARDERLAGASLVLSSPYTRAMQTAAIISARTGIPLSVSEGLHEWLPDTTFKYKSGEESAEASRECAEFFGEQADAAKLSWESLSDVHARAMKALRPYVSGDNAYKKIIVITHGILMRQFEYRKLIANCEIMEAELDGSERFHGFYFGACGVSVRTAHFGDLPEIYEAVKSTATIFPGLETEEALLRHMETTKRFIARGECLVALQGGIVIGCLLYSGKNSMICFLTVRDEFRRMKAASGMLSFAIKHMDRSRDITVSTFLEGEERGIAARALYRSFGFMPSVLTEAFGAREQVFSLPRL
ncbi:MAG: bifunctional histidine phosphatase family protein/GNAT family N-acetyltransferase [Eubacteriales bacterium]|nr:bifunctional histidine phosphatase family protein/GNAT family N-acetyltransferase [Eubacteriales bacterium]MDD3881615.1 bifunctional histidine phosphatase family protein/GNAT family N-acetyltransferase [Eubacteriales bacterium]MDD4512326.1 bifunctional histidine phosphatase family protein/GNAT family N-acetyltransferase [Eubacteriales bacterium]